MSNHKLVDYLLRLARDPDENAKFRKSPQSARQCMSTAGITPEHQELLLKRDSQKISEAVTATFPREPGATEVRMSVCFTAPPPVE